ncbi:MAG: GTP-binding protein, partial [Verrucomicrobiota bacterium]
VDHGTTTLVDKLLQDAGVFRDNEAVQDRAMDSMDLEKEKGITIKSKNAAVSWKGITINIVDTPGHADFGGEVERILKMVEGVLLIVDAAEGPQAQTRFVLRKAIEQNLELVVVINKIDREFANPEKAHDDVLELFLELNVDEKQFQAPFIYASAKDGYAVTDLNDAKTDMAPLFDTVLKHIPPPVADPDAPFHMLVSNLDWSDYVGRIAVGKIASGSVNLGDKLIHIDKHGERRVFPVTKLYTFSGLGATESEEGHAGDIVKIAGCEKAFIGETLCENETQEPVPFVEIDPPTIQMRICVNDGPLAGRDGKFLTARHLLERLVRETRTNISLQVEETDIGSAFRVSARGELQIAVLVETMRR